MATRYEIVLLDDAGECVLRLRDGRLPAFDLDVAPPWPDVAVVHDELAARYGIEAVILRALSVSDGDRRAPQRIYAAQYAGGRVPTGATWLADDQIDAANVAGHDGGGGRQPWYRPGWLAEMSAWIDERIDAAGFRRRGPIRQVRSWGRAALLSLETDRGRLWAKAVPDTSAHEVAVTELLADIDPGFVPPLVAVDRALGRIISEHVTGPSLVAVGDDDAVWDAASSRLAEVQRVLAADTGALAVAGVAAAPLDGLADAIPALLEDDEALGLGRAGGLTAAEARTLRGRQEALVDACRELATTAVPDSLDHGDLAGDEVILGDMGPVFLDWSDGSITHPFLSGAALVADRRALGLGGEDDLATAYLDPWLRDGTIGRDDAAEALQLARTVAPLHRAVWHTRRIAPALEQPWEMAGLVPEALRSILTG